MCGIFGFIFHKPVAVKHRAAVVQFFETMALVNVERGTDATGAALVTPGQVKLHKYTQSAFSVIRQKKWMDLLSEIPRDSHMLLGHTRAGTHGSNTIGNAHPFRFGTFVGTHNGVIMNHEDLNPKNPFENDSKNLFKALSRTASVKDIKKLLKKVDGSMAIAYWQDGYAYLARNADSPCYLSMIPELGAYAYSSTKDAISWGAAVAYLEHEVPVEIPENKLMRWSPRNADPTIQEFETYKKKPYIWTKPERSGSPTPLTRTTTYRGAGIHAGEHMVHYPTIPASIKCFECKKESKELGVRLVNSKVICSWCWTLRLDKYPGPKPRRCSHCNEPCSDMFQTYEDQIVCGNCYTGGVQLTQQGAD